MDIYLIRQVFILLTVMMFSANVAYMIAFPSVLMPALMSKNDTDIEATPAQVTWIATSNGVAGIFGYLTLSPILQIFGRKVAHITCCLCLLIGWIIFTLAHSVTALLAARIIQGVALCDLYIHAVILSEYSAPIRRGYFITIKKATFSVGILMCHSLSLIWNWRQMATFAIIFPTLSLIMALFWPESPSFLAMKGRFQESKNSYIWLHGDLNLEELHLLHSLQLQSVEKRNIEKWYQFLFKKDFVKPFLIVCVLILLLECCGIHYVLVFIIRIMIELVGDKSLAIYFTISADSFTVIASMLSCFIISYFNRRTVLLCFGASIVSLMFIIYIVTISSSITWLAPSLIVLHWFIVSISIVSTCFTISGEVFSLEYKGWSACLSGIIFTSLYTLMLKITPVIIENAGVGGFYAIYGLTVAVCLFVLYFILPETKDRALADIENEFKGAPLSTRDENRRLFSSRVMID